VHAPFDDRECFTALVAHELRAPIALQRALVEVTLADPNADTAALRAMGEHILASCTQQQRLIEALLDLARSARALARQQPIDIAVIAAASLRAHDLREFESVVALKPAPTTGDPDLLARLADNLVTNAVRHNIADGRIEVATRARTGGAVLSIANTGPPIPPAELPRLFEPFQKLVPYSASAAQGIGLGLTIVHAIADAHHAAVTAQAQPGGGLKIDVDFPATAPRCRRSDSRSPASWPKTGAAFRSSTGMAATLDARAGLSRPEEA
jgi:signal transduction histidine kinase